MTRPEGGLLLVMVNQLGSWPLPGSLLEEGLRWVLAKEGVEEGELSVTFMPDADIRGLNRDYLGEDHPTDVIAFPLHESGDPIMGDVYVGYDQAVSQAQELGVALEEELLRLAIHGTLHVLGHDHPPGPERWESPMFVRQESLLAEILSRPTPGDAP